LLTWARIALYRKNETKHVITIKTKIMKKTKIIYWTFTILFAFIMFDSAVPDIFSVQMAVEGFKDIGMPTYLLPFLGVGKTLGVIALFVPGYPRVREWAYAGLVFDLLGATYSIAASGKPMENWIGMALPLLLAAGSYIWYDKLQKAKNATTETARIYRANRIPQASIA
jgi:uncharacterized membrane protein YphA (DoxX/SURF4 family)